MRVTDEMTEVVAKAIHAARYDTDTWIDRPRPVWDEQDKNSREYVFRLARAALEAALAVEGTDAKPVAWQRRILYPSVPGAVSKWQPCKASEATDPFARVSGYEFRPLYTTPPAGIREALEKAAQEAYRICAETRHLSLGDEIASAIRALRGQS